MISASEVVKLREKMEKVHNILSSMYCTDEVLFSLLAMREYYEPHYLETFREIGIFRVDSLEDLQDALPDVTEEDFRDMGLINDKGFFLLRGMHAIPIRDISGMITAWVGLNPRGGVHKYVTTPTKGFSRDALFFNIDDAYKRSWRTFAGKVIVVEGIFDALCLRALGFPALAVMGLSLTWIKAQILNRFTKAVVIADNDKGGRSINPLYNTYRKKTWDIGIDYVYVILPEEVKDIDKFAAKYDIYEDIMSCFEASYIRKLKLEGGEVVAETVKIPESVKDSENE